MECIMRDAVNGSVTVVMLVRIRTGDLGGKRWLKPSRTLVKLSACVFFF